MRVSVSVESNVPQTARVAQLAGMFDVPPSEKSRMSWEGDVPIEEQDWKVGLIVGPSGAGKSTVARHILGDSLDAPLEWSNSSVIDDFDERFTIEEITSACSAVGFNTIPSWMRPFHVLSNGEKFRAELARRLLEGDDLVAVDEFTSVVDRQVAKIGAHAVQKLVRKHPTKRFVAVTCHYDVLEWLRPDWILEPHKNMRFEWTAGRWVRRPQLQAYVSPVPYSAWSTFARYHYMSASLPTAARCFGIWVDNTLAGFVGVIVRPSGGKRMGNQSVRGVSRVVVLPDWQGLGLAFHLVDTVASAWKAVGVRFRNYPAHPAYIKAHDKSPTWALIQKPGGFQAVSQINQVRRRQGISNAGLNKGRPCAVFEYAGPAMEKPEAERLLGLGLWKSVRRTKKYLRFSVQPGSVPVVVKRPE